MTTCGMEGSASSFGTIGTLPWLPEAPSDFKECCNALLAKPTPESGAEVRRLAGYRLSSVRIVRLARVISALKDVDALALLEPLRLSLVSNASTQFLIPFLVVAAARYGFALDVVEVPFGQVMQPILDENSSLYAPSPDVVLLALDYRFFGFGSLVLHNAEELVVAALNQVLVMREKIAKIISGPVIVQTLAPMPERLFGSFDLRFSGSPAHLIEAFNCGLIQQLAKSSDLILDVAGMSGIMGGEQWHNPVQWHMAKLPFDYSCTPLYADYLCRLLAAMRGRSCKCLVLDLDNTVWGGVIGDDGLQGIRLGPGTADGEAYLEIQRMALELRKRGIVLCVSSKNEESNARLPFREHGDMLLREEHIAVFQANWSDKSSNLEAIAKTLDIGLDALVFLDDNPAERALVRRVLPQVWVPELPNDPALYPRVLAAAGYFEAVSFSEEDAFRAEQYQANFQRVALSRQSPDLDSYLLSLQMVASYGPFDLKGRSRITQLINKTNQFNLTTRRYTEAEVATFEVASDVFTLQVRLKDCFGDNGMISVVICRESCKQDDRLAWDIDVWLMSCRVFGRRLDEVVLNVLIESARKAGVAELLGVYRPSKRNALVRDHFQGLGFEKINEDAHGVTSWRLDIKKASIRDVPIQVTDVN